MMFGGGTMVLAWLIPLVGGYFLVKYLIDQNKSSTDSESDPLTILKRRYAKGEINQQEFEEYKKNLLNV